MRRLLAGFGLAIGLCLLAEPAMGQPWWGWGWRGGPATYGESVMRGAADVIRSAGTYNVRTSEAAKNWEQVRSAAYDNRVKAARTFVESKEIQRAYQKTLFRPVPTSEQMFRMARMELPKKLTSNQLDPVTGRIRWPLELTAEDYADVRRRLEKLFAERASQDGKVTLEQYEAINEALDEMRAVLKKRLDNKKVTPQDWTTASRFLKQLRMELRYNE